MKHTLVVLAVFMGSCASALDAGFKITWGVGFNAGSKFFFDMPRTVGNATAMGWSQVERPSSPLSSLPMYCYGPPYKVCCMYDPDTGYVAGFQIGLPLNEFTGAVFDWTIQGFIPWTPTVTDSSETVTYMTKQVYFISEETLSKNKEERMKAVAQDKVLQEDHVWPVGFNQKLMAVSTNDAGIVANGFTKQHCIPLMGTHYFYNMTTQAECSADSFLNWFLLVDSGKLIGMGLVVIGVMPENSGERYFFERPSAAAVQLILKDYPKCLAKLTENPTCTTMHMYFVDNPWNVGCWSY